MESSNSSATQEVGYFVPENQWAELQDACDAMDAVADIADGPQRDVVVSTTRITALIDMFRDKIEAVRNSARFLNGRPS